MSGGSMAEEQASPPATAAQIVDEHHQTIHRLQSQLTQNLRTLRLRAPLGADLGAYYRAFEAFDTELERIKEGMEHFHSQLIHNQLAHQQQPEGQPSRDTRS